MYRDIVSEFWDNCVIMEYTLNSCIFPSAHVKKLRYFFSFFYAMKLSNQPINMVFVVQKKQGDELWLHVSVK